MTYSIVVYLYYRKRKKHVYIAGDFNVNTGPTLRCDGNTQKFKNILSSIFLFPLIDKPTRVTRHSATVIDNIYCNASDIQWAHIKSLHHINQENIYTKVMFKVIYCEN